MQKPFHQASFFSGVIRGQGDNFAKEPNDGPCIIGGKAVAHDISPPSPFKKRAMRAAWEWTWKWRKTSLT